MLKRLVELAESTPTWGVLKETGIWQIKELVVYQRKMLLRDLLMLKGERLSNCKGKIAVKNQGKDQE